MAGNKNRKQLLKEPDQFISFSTKMMNYIIKHKIAVLSSTGIVFALIIIISGIRYFSIQEENKSFALMEKALARYETLEKEKGPEKAFEETQKDFQSIIDQYASRGGGRAARIAFANIAFQAKNFDKAVDLYKKALEDLSDDSSLKNMILSSLGYSYEGKNDYENAEKYFNMIVKGKDSLLKDDAVFNLGRIYAKMEKQDKSMEFYKKLVDEYPESMYIDMINEKISDS
ncbi:Tetratricopeptide repeat-containing protein [Desulfonema limicola]|uniref:Tetratricopeptide repeat-containing protein n=1 Tax=Desulfonema limicola TaxID=45656 RepID=A0A975GKC0_9BACT|nr:tetratricopeptide repeat protein [Desulfonema limicola]QTA83653.1 Tetratricopeptide repeat-containing protein [Desulfonema limicola]